MFRGLMLKTRKRKGSDIMLCTECDIEMDTHRFNGKQYYICGKCGKEAIIEGDNAKIEEISESTDIQENKEYLNDESDVTLKRGNINIDEDYNKKEKIRNILTPDVRACEQCIDEYRVDITCSKCSIVMLKPSYNGKVYECPICQKLYCESCWNKMD